MQDKLFFIGNSACLVDKNGGENLHVCPLCRIWGIKDKTTSSP